MPPGSEIRRTDPPFDARQFSGMPGGYPHPVFSGGPTGVAPHHSLPPSAPPHLHPQGPPDSTYYVPMAAPPPLPPFGPPSSSGMGESGHASIGNPMSAIPSSNRTSNGGGGVQWVEEESKESTDTVLVRITEIHQAVTEEDMRRVFESVGTAARQLIFRAGRHDDEVIVVATFADTFAAEHVMSMLNMRNIYDNGNKMSMSFIVRRPVGDGPVEFGSMPFGMNGGGGPAPKNPHGGGGRMGGGGGRPPGGPSSPFLQPMPPPPPMDRHHYYDNGAPPPEAIPHFAGNGGGMRRADPNLHPPMNDRMRMTPPHDPHPPMMGGKPNEREGRFPLPPPVPLPYAPPGGEAPFMPGMRGRGGYTRGGGMLQPYYSGDSAPPVPPNGRGRGRGGYVSRGGRGRERGGGGAFSPFFPSPDAPPLPHREFYGRGGLVMNREDGGRVPFPAPLYGAPYGPPVSVPSHPHHVPPSQTAEVRQRGTPYLSVIMMPLKEPLHSIFVLLEAFGGVISIRRNHKNKEIIAVKMVSSQDADAVVQYLQHVPFCGTTVSSKRFPSYVEQSPCTDDGDSRDPDTVQFDFTAAQHRSPGQRCNCAPTSWVKVTGCGDLTEADLKAYFSENNFFPTRITRVENAVVSKSGKNNDFFVLQLSDVDTAVKLLITCQGNVCGIEKSNILFIPERSPNSQATNINAANSGNTAEQEEDRNGNAFMGAS